MEASQLQVPAALCPEEKLTVPTEQKTGWVPEKVYLEERQILVRAENRNTDCSIVQPTA
jgi:hypothetical protein